MNLALLEIAKEFDNGFEKAMLAMIESGLTGATTSGYTEPKTVQEAKNRAKCICVSNFCNSRVADSFKVAPSGTKNNRPEERVPYLCCGGSSIAVVCCRLLCAVPPSLPPASSIEADCTTFSSLSVALPMAVGITCGSRPGLIFLKNILLR